MEVSMSKTRRGKYTDNRICYISKCKGDMRLYLRRKGKLPCFSYLVRGKSFSFYRGKITTPDGKEILKSVSEDIPSGEEFDTGNVDKFMTALNDYEKHALNARNSVCQEITQAWLNEQAKKGAQFRRDEQK